MHDHTGFLPPPPAAPFRPRRGQWLRFTLADPAHAAALERSGAHQARDGFFVGIFVEGHHQAAAQADGQGGTVVRRGPWVPAYVQPVDAGGNNLPVAVPRPGGHLEVRNVFFYWDGPALAVARPLESLEDFPPGRARHPDWRPTP